METVKAMMMMKRAQGQQTSNLFRGREEEQLQRRRNVVRSKRKDLRVMTSMLFVKTAKKMRQRQKMKMRQRQKQRMMTRRKKEEGRNKGCLRYSQQERQYLLGPPSQGSSLFVCSLSFVRRIVSFLLPSFWTSF